MKILMNNETKKMLCGVMSNSIMIMKILLLLVIFIILPVSYLPEPYNIFYCVFTLIVILAYSLWVFEARDADQSSQAMATDDKRERGETNSSDLGC